MKLRKIFVFIITIIATTSLLVTQAFAWGGYAHWEIARRASTSLSSYNSTFYKSGSLFADIGKSSWDDNYTISDSEAFANKIVQIANEGSWTGTGTKYLAYGWKAHFIQDTQGSLANIETTKSWWPYEYRGKSGWVDEYLRDDQNITSPINGTEGYGINYALIRSTYNELDNFSPSDSQIDDEISDMYALYHVQIAYNMYGWTAAEKESIENELDRTAGLCNTVYSSSLMLDADTSNTPLNVETKQNIEFEKNNLKRTIKEELKNIRLLKITEIEKMPTENKDEYIVDYVINDKAKYDKKIEEIANLIKTSNFSYDELYK